VGVDLQRPYFIYGVFRTRHVGRDRARRASRSGGDGTGDLYRVPAPKGRTKRWTWTPKPDFTRRRKLRRHSSHRPGTGEAAVSGGAGRGEPELYSTTSRPSFVSQNSPTLYMGAEKVFKRTNGVYRERVPSGLTKGKPNSETGEGRDDKNRCRVRETRGSSGQAPDDGNLSVTRDAGKTWTNGADRLPGAVKGAQAR